MDFFKFVRIYGKIGASYGFCRGLSFYNNTLEDYKIIQNKKTCLKETIIEEKKEYYKRPILYSELALITFINTSISTIYFPAYLFRDIREYELKKRGYRNPNKYDSIFDYINFG